MTDKQSPFKSDYCSGVGVYLFSNDYFLSKHLSFRTQLDYTFNIAQLVHAVKYDGITLQYIPRYNIPNAPSILTYSSIGLHSDLRYKVHRAVSFHFVVEPMWQSGGRLYTRRYDAGDEFVKDNSKAHIMNPFQLRLKQGLGFFFDIEFYYDLLPTYKASVCEEKYTLSVSP